MFGDKSDISKMALDGYVIQLDFSDIRELNRLLRNATNNLNQIAKRTNETDCVLCSRYQKRV